VGDLLNWRSDGRDWLGLTFRVFAGLHDEATRSWPPATVAWSSSRKV